MKKWICLFLFCFSTTLFAYPKIELSQHNADIIGHRIWQNEAQQRVEYLTWWNKGEDFASVGIGHFIWYPEGVNGIFFEMFTHYLHYAQQQGVVLPQWLRNIPACPWHNRQAFMAAQQSEPMQQLRQFLLSTVDLQTQFMIHNLNQAIPTIINSVSGKRRQHIQQQLNYMIATHNGAYALVDYANFKGLGLYPAERYHDQGWGLLQVLEKMDAHNSGPEALAEFRTAAIHMLQQRVQNAPAARDESRWLLGWIKRINTYKS